MSEDGLGNYFEETKEERILWKAQGDWLVLYYIYNEEMSIQQVKLAV